VEREEEQVIGWMKEQSSPEGQQITLVALLRGIHSAVLGQQKRLAGEGHLVFPAVVQVLWRFWRMGGKAVEGSRVGRDAKGLRAWTACVFIDNVKRRMEVKDDMKVCSRIRGRAIVESVYIYNKFPSSVGGWGLKIDIHLSSPPRPPPILQASEYV